MISSVAATNNQPDSGPIERPSEQLVLVDKNDNPIGTMEKLQTHREGRLHRAFSVFVFNAQGQLLLQQRNPAKYHSGGLWANTCCSHPRPDERVAEAAMRRLEEEMGFTCPVEPVFTFLYRAEFANGLVEHEFDHVFTARYDQTPVPNPDEVSDWKWVTLAQLSTLLRDRPDAYVPWLQICFEKVRQLPNWSGIQKEQR